MNVVSFQADGASEMNSSRWRGLVMVRPMRTAGHTVHTPNIAQWMAHTDEAKRLCAQADLIILQRVMVEESVERARFWQARGKPIVVDIDDHYQLIDPSNAAHKFWGLGEVEVHAAPGVSFKKTLARHPLAQFIAGVQAHCTGLTMPSRFLADEWRAVCPTWYVPNYIDAANYLAARAQVRPDPRYVTIGYGGSMSHVPSFQHSGVEEALRRVVAQRPRVRLMICGDKRVHDRLPVPADRKLHRNYVIWSDWSRVVAQFDIGIAPLAKTYDHARSFIKTMEFSLMGIPFVATGCPTYREWQDAGVGLYVEDGPESEKAARADAWEAALLDVVDRYDEHKARIDSQLEFAMGFDAERNVGNVIRTYEEIVSWNQ